MPASRTVNRTAASRPRLGCDQQLSRSILHVDHRVRAVHEQVQNDLLKLDTIASDDREIVGELRRKNT